MVAKFDDTVFGLRRKAGLLENLKTTYGLIVLRWKDGDEAERNAAEKAIIAIDEYVKFLKNTSADSSKST